VVEAACHCRAVVLELAEPPAHVFDCNCSICRKLGVLWAYYSPQQVVIRCAPGATRVYVWGDRRLEFHTCGSCGCTTHWQAIEQPATRMGVNARLVEGLSKANARLHHLDGASSGAFWT
jgi:hypothetical protein